MSFPSHVHLMSCYMLHLQQLRFLYPSFGVAYCLLPWGGVQMMLFLEGQVTLSRKRRRKKTES